MNLQTTSLRCIIVISQTEIIVRLQIGVKTGSSFLVRRVTIDCTLPDVGTLRN